MRRLSTLVFVVALLMSCAGAPSATSAPALSAGPSLDSETRALLEELVRVDTSDGHETQALEPLKKRFESAGVPAEIVESAPGRGSLVARIKGNGTKRPLLLLAHIDVVPVAGQPWTTPPFVPTEKDGRLYGRGVNDDKSMVASIAVIALELAKQKTPLSRDLIVAFTAGEETGGGAGIRWVLAHRRELVDAEIALNEGGFVRLAPDESRVGAVGIGAAEKTFQSYKLVVKGKGGHSSLPPPDVDPTAILGHALVKLGEYKFPMRVLPQVKDSLALAGVTEPAPLGDALRHAAAGAPTIAAADAELLAKDRIFGALVRTTCVTTMLKGASQDNVLPTEVEAVVNCRILPDETREATHDVLVGVIGDPRVSVVPYEASAPQGDYGFGPSEDVTGLVPDAIRNVVGRMWPGTKVVGSMTTGATDSRHLRAAGIHAFGLSTSFQTDEEGRSGHTAHGPDERRPIKWIGEGTRFLRELVLELAR